MNNQREYIIACKSGVAFLALIAVLSQLFKSLNIICRVRSFFDRRYDLKKLSKEELICLKRLKKQ